MLVQLAARLQERGHPQHVVSLNGRGVFADTLEKNGVQVIDLALKSPFDLPQALFRLRRVITHVKPDVVQGWMYYGNIVAALAHRLAPVRARRRLFWGLRASDMDAARYGKINWLSARLSRWPDMVIANSASGARFHIALGYRPRQLEIVPNGVDCARFRPDEQLRNTMRLELGIAPDAVVAIHVARVDAMKDHPTFLAAMKRISHVTGLLVGKDTDALALPANVRALGLRGDVQRLYDGADIVVSSSAFGEGFSNTIAEGMSAGLVPVATDVGDVRLIIGTAGKVVPPGDAAALAAALGEIAALAPERRRALGGTARARIVENFAIDAAVTNYELLYSRS